MNKYLIIVQRDDDVKSYPFDTTEGISQFCEMLRDLKHPYEIYKYDDQYGYQRTCRYSAQI